MACLRPRACSLGPRGLGAELLRLCRRSEPQSKHHCLAACTTGGRGIASTPAGLDRVSPRGGAWRPLPPGGVGGRRDFPLASAASSSYREAGGESDGKGPGSEKRKKKGGRKRLDELCREAFPQHSRSLLQSWIMQGKVTVDGKTVTKSGFLVSSSSKVVIKASEPKYVCRAGLKMEAALEAFDVDVAGKTVLDSGLSTGGFTDCLLQNGAARVYGVDVGYGQVAEKIRVDERVVVMERVNLRYLAESDLPEKVQIVSLDLSFISVLKVMDAITQVLEPGGDLITLIKPQFEAKREEISRGGLVRSEETHRRVTKHITEGIVDRGFEFKQLIESPITGAQSGNKEFLAHFKKLL
ncbi:rRNA methyltransferase [Chloropicon primus]|uniref:rRNA methyltransferase n=2 Tax=Chloropicon primus TaxID=1764295 RepID=A0A5B8MKP8_9CHLO|nr:rRNA methyltransferase [Chloropicon primus]UPR00054.1 rRNA methyltransferase [Chloropicon primus]|eukprot:QDZ20841.1 rRNA methyltransferase [Chloropicon primus]